MKHTPELVLGKRLDTDLGRKYKGHVAVGNHKIPITYREPAHDNATNVAYVNANGLTAGKRTMRTPAREAVRAGFKAVTLDYTNKWVTNALDANARDVASVMDALSAEGLRVRGLALSEGGRVTARALKLVQNPVEAATLVAPAGLILNNNLSWGQGIRRLGAAGPEVAGIFFKHPLSALHLGVSCLHNCTSRPFGVVGEMHELRTGDEQQTVRDLKSAPSSTYLRVAYGLRDMLLQKDRQEAGIAVAPVDDVFPYDGRHCDVTTKPFIAQEIYRRDEAIAPKLPEHPLIDMAA
jgi:hypothetical protein